MSCNVNKADFYPKKMYWCPCLTYLFNEIYNADICNYSTILKAITIGKMLPILLFCTKTDRRMNGIAVCTLNLKQFLLAGLHFYVPHKEKTTFTLKVWTTTTVNNVLDITYEKWLNFILSLFLTSCERIKFNHFS